MWPNEKEKPLLSSPRMSLGNQSLKVLREPANHLIEVSTDIDLQESCQTLEWLVTRLIGKVFPIRFVPKPRLIASQQFETCRRTPRMVGGLEFLSQSRNIDRGRFVAIERHRIGIVLFRD